MLCLVGWSCPTIENVEKKRMRDDATINKSQKPQTFRYYRRHGAERCKHNAKLARRSKSYKMSVKLMDAGLQHRKVSNDSLTEHPEMDDQSASLEYSKQSNKIPSTTPPSSNTPAQARLPGRRPNSCKWQRLQKFC